MLSKKNRKRLDPLIDKHTVMTTDIDNRPLFNDRDSVYNMVDEYDREIPKDNFPWLIAVILFVIVSGLCSVFYQFRPNRVDQYVLSKSNEPHVATYVWKGGNIVKSWYDKVEGLPKGLEHLRKHQGDSVLKRLENIPSYD